MKCRFIIYCLPCFSVMLGAMQRPPNADRSEQKFEAMIGAYFACLQRCHADKHQISIPDYKNRKKECNKPFVQLLLQLDKESKN